MKSGGGDVAKSAAASSGRGLAITHGNRTRRPWTDGVGKAFSSPFLAQTEAKKEFAARKVVVGHGKSSSGKLSPSLVPIPISNILLAGWFLDVLHNQTTDG